MNRQTDKKEPGLRKRNFLAGMKNAIPIGLAYFAVSFAFGIQAVGTGLSPFQAFLVSLTNLTSAGQFAALGVIAAGAPYFEMALTQLLINLRYFLMSTSLSQKLDPGAPFFHRFPVAFGVTDEIFALNISVEGALSPYFAYGAMALAIPGWSLGTLLGALCGDILPHRAVSALGVALYGMFVAIVVPPAKSDRGILGAVVLSAALSAFVYWNATLGKISFGFQVILITLSIAVICALLFPRKDGMDDA